MDGTLPGPWRTRTGVPSWGAVVMGTEDLVDLRTGRHFTDRR
jgi:hypothetical protein